MHYCGLKKIDIANGLGVRVSLFVSGCRNRCAGCFQPETWDFDYGDPFTPAVQREVLDALRPVWIQGLSILGGEPMEPENQAALFPFLLDVKETFPDKDIWLYTGFPYEKVADSPLLSFVDVVVDGPFDEAQKDAGLAFRGSRNQRIIDLKAKTILHLDGGTI